MGTYKVRVWQVVHQYVDMDIEAESENKAMDEAYDLVGSDNTIWIFDGEDITKAEILKGQTK